MPVIPKPRPRTDEERFVKAVDAFVKFIWQDLPLLERQAAAKERRNAAYQREFKRKGLV